MMIVQKGGQVTKPIMHGCEIPCEHVFEVKRFLINSPVSRKLKYLQNVNESQLTKIAQRPVAVWRL